MTDIMLADRGILGTAAPPGKENLRPQIYWSNSDALWAAKYHQSRIGQGGFRSAFRGVHRKIEETTYPPTGPLAGSLPRFRLPEIFYGKPFKRAMEYAENTLRSIRTQRHAGPLQTVYMIGDNPFSDIAGANQSEYASKNVSWKGILVRTGVFQGTEQLPTTNQPFTIQEAVSDAVDWAIREEGWPDKHVILSKPKKSYRRVLERAQKDSSRAGLSDRHSPM